MKRCTGCSQVKSLADFSPDRRASDGCQARCRTCKADYAREQYKSPAEAESVRARSRSRAEELREAVFGHYGTVCACCGSSNDPTIDHVGGDGRGHREQLFNGGRGGHGSQLYRWLIKNGFPEGFQTLCRPCNGSKKEGDHCNLSHGQDRRVAA